MFQVKVNYFALFREQAGLSEEVISLEGGSALQLFRRVTEKYQFSLIPEQVRVAVNDAFVSWETVLKDGDEVVFIPPVAGG